MARGTIAGASAPLSSFDASSAVTRSSRDWMAAALLPEAAVFTARSATGRRVSEPGPAALRRDSSFKHVFLGVRKVATHL